MAEKLGTGVQGLKLRFGSIHGRRVADTAAGMPGGLSGMGAVRELWRGHRRCCRTLTHAEAADAQQCVWRRFQKAVSGLSLSGSGGLLVRGPSGTFHALSVV